MRMWKNRGMTGASLVDPSDPAFAQIVRAAKQLIEFGFDPSDPDIARRAIKVGRKMFAETSAQRETRRSTEIVSGHERLVGDGTTSVVYYMGVGNRVKIGWSNSLALRVSSLAPEILYGTEPGTRELEKVRHAQFAELRTRNEWFRLVEPLVTHVQKIVDESA